MTHNRTADYWISPNALRIELNAMSLPDYIQASCTSGAQILCYLKDIITYDAGHNYRRWTLTASPTAFNTHTPKYVYVAIPRDTTKTNAQVVFPSEKIDIYGKAQHTVDGVQKEEQVGSEDYYYIFLQGIMSTSGDNGTTPRQWTQRIDTGTLSSDEALNAKTDSEWYQYSTVDQITTFLKDLTMKAGTKFYQLFADTLTIVSGGKIKFGTDEGAPYVDSIAQSDGTSTESANKIVTPKYMDDKALSKSHSDKTDYDLEMQNLKVNGTADIFGNVTIHDNGKFSIGTYNKGIQGAQIDWYGNAEFESIVARSFLEVPELRYNRTTITVGNKWQTVGAGIIERVWAGTGDNALTGIAKLKLEATEPGAIAVDDKCQGIFHFTTGNDSTTSDPKNGNYHFAGFTTVYFIVKEIYTADTLPADIKADLADETIDDNQFFRYELRAKTCADLAEDNRNRWTDAHHPQPSMHFACYANATNSARQACRLTTTTYQLHLAGMTDWTYTQDQIRLIIGWLDGFTLKKQVWDSAQQKLVQQDKPLEGEGIAVGNMYMWGTIDQFDRAPYLMSQQLYYRGLDDDLTPREITLSADRKTYSLNGWGTTPVTPSPTTRYVWQQWLYAYSDGTYGTSNVSLSALDNTLLTVTSNRTLVSVAISDWYDPNNPDDVTFELTAQIKSGTEPLAITTATAQYSSDGATLSYTTQLSADHKTVTYHITLTGYVGVPIDGATPEDAYLTLALTTALGTGIASVTISQNREGEAGQDGADGIDGLDGKDGQDGKDGLDGKSAYELWKEAGNTGTEADFLESLIGASGKSVSTITEYYARNNDKDNAPTGSDWSTTLTNPDADHLYLWNKETILDSDGEEITTTTPVIIATYTKDGKGISSITEWYALSTSITDVTGTWGTTVPTMDHTNRYLWNKEIIAYTDSSTTTTTPAVIGVYGDPGSDGVTMNENLCDGTLDGTGWSFMPETGYRGSKTFATNDLTLYDYVTDVTSGMAFSLIQSPEIASPLRDTPMTLSFDARILQGDDVSLYDFFRVRVSYTNGSRWTPLLDQTISRNDLTADWHTFQFAVPALPSEDDIPEGHGLRVRIENLGDPASPYAENEPNFNPRYLRTIHVRRVKLEYGNTVSPWCLSENDKRGQQGAEGLIVRRTEWEVGKYYRNDTDQTSGTRYLDEVCVTNAAQNTSTWWMATASHNGTESADINRPGTSSGFWTPLNDMAPIRTPYADIQNAFIQFLNVAQIILQTVNAAGQNEIYGAFGNPTGENQWPLWFGATTPEEAPFRVNSQGELTCANVNTTFQDLRSYDCGGMLNESYDIMDNEAYGDGISRPWLNLSCLKTGATTESWWYDDGSNVVTIQKNIYNLRIDGMNILLPISDAWIGQRILLYNGCRKKQAQDNPTGSSELQQELTRVRMELTGTSFKKFAGARQFNIKEIGQSGIPTYQLNSVSTCTEIEFWDGVLEFIAVPDTDGTCIWAIINDSAGAVWYDGNPIRNMI